MEVTQTTSALDGALASLINATVAGAEATADFLSAEIPEVLRQLLMWKALESFLGFLFGLALLVTLAVVLVKFSGRGKVIEPAGKYAERYQQTITHTESGKMGDRVIPLAALAVLVPIIGMTVMATNLEWLQILVAPKVYLIEYGAWLVKGIPK